MTHPTTTRRTSALAPTSLALTSLSPAALALTALLSTTLAPAAPAQTVSEVQRALQAPAPGREPVTFALHAPGAGEVTLEFTGNYWNRRPEDRVALARTGADPSHAVTLHLGAGQWLYRFRVDGTWRHDERNPRTVGAENGQRNSVLFVGERPAPDPDVARGRLVETTLPSAAFDRDLPIVVYHPPGDRDTDAAPLPVLLLLHGFGQPASDWSAAIEVHRAMERLLAAGEIVPFVLAMPSGEDGFWLGAHERHVLDEVLPWLEREHDVAIGPDTTAIGGFSAGGHGALHLGWLAQGRVGLVMPIAMAARCTGNVCREEDFARLYPGDTELEFALWVGVNDELGLERNHAAFSDRLDALGIAHEDTRSDSAGHLEDGHSVRYVRTIAEDVLRRASRHFERR